MEKLFTIKKNFFRPFFYCIFLIPNFHSQTQNQKNVHPNAHHFETFQVEIVAFLTIHFGSNWIKEDSFARCFSYSW